MVDACCIVVDNCFADGVVIFHVVGSCCVDTVACCWFLFLTLLLMSFMLLTLLMSFMLLTLLLVSFNVVNIVVLIPFMLLTLC